MFSFLKRVKIKTMDIQEFVASNNKGNLIDVREIDEYKAGKIKGAKNIPMRQLLGKPEQYLDQEKSYYLYCFSGSRSKTVAKRLTKQGYDVVNLTGGYRKLM